MNDVEKTSKPLLYSTVVMASGSTVYDGSVHTKKSEHQCVVSFPFFFFKRKAAINPRSVFRSRSAGHPQLGLCTLMCLEYESESNGRRVCWWATLANVYLP